MGITLWSGSDLLGEADIAESRGLGARFLVHMGVFLPTDAFARVWPALERMNRVTAEWAAVQARLDPATTADAMRDHLREQVTGGKLSAMTHARDAVAALALELRDESGRAVSCVSISVTECDPYAAYPVDAVEDADTDESARRPQVATRTFMLAATTAPTALPIVVRTAT